MQLGTTGIHRVEGIGKGGMVCLPEIDWNELWKEAQKKKHTPVDDSDFWNRRAPSFASHASGSDYVGQFLGIMKPEPQWTVLDIGCAAGTLAVPLAAVVKSVTALDRSTVMLCLLEDRCRDEHIANIRIVEGRWEDDWDELGIGVHDVAVASRSLIVEDLRTAVLKLESRARKRVYLSTLVDNGPYDHRIVEAVGRRFYHGADYILVYNLLRQMGIFANVSFTVKSDDKTYRDLDDALGSVRWMVYEMTQDEEGRLRSWLRDHLIRENGRWKLPYRQVVRWAVLWWEKDAAMCRE